MSGERWCWFLEVLSKWKMVQSFSVALRVWFGNIWPTSFMYLNFASSGTPRGLALGLALAAVVKLCYIGVLCLVHFKKVQASLPFIFSTGETERWHWDGLSLHPSFLSHSLISGLLPDSVTILLPSHFRAWIHFWNAKTLFGYSWQGKMPLKKPERNRLN